MLERSLDVSYLCLFVAEKKDKHVMNRCFIYCTHAYIFLAFYIKKFSPGCKVLAKESHCIEMALELSFDVLNFIGR